MWEFRPKSDFTIKYHNGNPIPSSLTAHDIADLTTDASPIHFTSDNHRFSPLSLHWPSTPSKQRVIIMQYLRRPCRHSKHWVIIMLCLHPLFTRGKHWISLMLCFHRPSTRDKHRITIMMCHHRLSTLNKHWIITELSHRRLSTHYTQDTYHALVSPTLHA